MDINLTDSSFEDGRKQDLFLRQKELLDTFLKHGAISRVQYDKSLGDLTVKMDMEPSGEPKV